MTWIRATRQVGGKYFNVYYEDILTISGRQKWSSEMDFIPPGTDFLVVGNTGATDLSACTHIELYAAFAASAVVASRYRINRTPFKPLTAELDAVTPHCPWDVSVKGQYPYYYLKIPSGGGNGTSQRFYVLVGSPVDAISVIQ
jgi:hypothetical protein